MTLPVSIVAKPSVQISHHRIHEGNHFTMHKINMGIDPAFPKYFLIIPPPLDPIPSNTVEIHFIFEIDAANFGVTAEFFEGSTASGINILPIINNNRNSTTTALTVVIEDPTVVSEGTKIFEELIGTTTSGGEGGENIRDEDEIILKVGTNYLIKITPLTPGPNTNITTELNWYDQRPSSPVPL